MHVFSTVARTSLAATALAALVAAAATPSVPGTAGEIVIGQVVDNRGANSELSRDYLAGAKVYFDHINSIGGINGRRIVHSLRDDGGDPAKTVELTRELIDSPRTAALFGYVGDDNVRAVIKSELPKRAGIGFIAPLSGAEAGGWSDNVIYARASYSAEARAIVRRFRSNGMTRFAILQSAGEYGKAVRTAVETDLRSDGIAMTDARILVEGQALDADVAALLKAGPQVVFDFAESTNRGSHFVEVTFLRNNGNLLH